MDHRTVTIFEKITRMIKLGNIYLNHGPGHEKHALCARLRNEMLDLYVNSVDAYHSFHKKKQLSDLNKNHIRVRMLINLYRELGYFHYRRNKRTRTSSQAMKSYRALSDMNDEIGRMIGGWIKSDNESKAK